MQNLIYISGDEDANSASWEKILQLVKMFKYQGTFVKKNSAEFYLSQLKHFLYL